MADEKPIDPTKDEAFLNDMEAAVRHILKGRKVSTSDRIAAIREGTKLAMIRYRISTGDEEANKGFFDK